MSNKKNARYQFADSGRFLFDVENRTPQYFERRDAINRVSTKCAKRERFIPLSIYTYHLSLIIYHLFIMIFFPFDNRKSPIQLFHKKQANHLM